MFNRRGDVRHHLFNSLSARSGSLNRLEIVRRREVILYIGSMKSTSLSHLTTDLCLNIGL